MALILNIVGILWLMMLTGQTIGLRCMVSKSDVQVGDVVNFYCIRDFRVSSTPIKLILKYGKALEQQRIQTSSNVSLTTTITAEDNYRPFVCKERDGQKTVDNCNLIPFAIPTTVTIRSHQTDLSEGDIAAYTCNAEAQPPAVPSDYSWYFKGAPVTSGSPSRIHIAQAGRKIKIFDITLSDNNSEVKCVVINSVGINGTDTLKLKIQKPLKNKDVLTTPTLLKNNNSLVTKISVQSTKKPDVIYTTSVHATDESDMFVTDEMFSTILALEQADSDTSSFSNVKLWYYNVIEGTAIGGFVLLVMLIMFTSCLIGLVLRRKSKGNTEWEEEQEREVRKLKRLSIIPDETRVGMTENDAYLSPAKTNNSNTVSYMNQTTSAYHFPPTPPVTHVSHRSASLPLTTLSTRYDDPSTQDYVNTIPRHHDDAGYVNAPGTSDASNVFNFDQMQVNAYLNEEYNRLSELYENDPSLSDIFKLETTA